MRSLFAIKRTPRTLVGELLNLFKVASCTIFAVTIATLFDPAYVPMVAVAFPVSWLVFELLCRNAAAVVVLVVFAFAVHYYAGFYLLGVILLSLMMFVELEDPRYANRGRGKSKLKGNPVSADSGDWGYLDMCDPAESLRVNGRFAHVSDRIQITPTMTL